MRDKHYYTKFEEKLAYHCGPALAGIKPANLICMRKKDIPVLNDLVMVYNQRMNGKGIFLKILRECNMNCSILVYREDKLCKSLRDAKTLAILDNSGYPKYKSLDQHLDHLKNRFKEKGSVPNEIGVFLGYPPDDVLAFEKNKGKDYLVAKYWKVYHNEEDAKKLFTRFDKCRDALCCRLSRGMSLIDIFAQSA